MLEDERHISIKKLLVRKTFAGVREIAAYLSVSEATVRRDLSKMVKDGLLQRVRGGARILGDEKSSGPVLPEMPFEYRRGLFLEKKRRIAQEAVRLCGDGDTIIIDGGSTTFQMAEYLKARRMTIITNSFALAEVLVKTSANTLILPGGVLYPDSRLVLDHFHTDYYANFSADRVFMGVFGIDEQGMTNTDTLLIRTERNMIERAREVCILADSGKFKQRGNLRLCGFDKVTALITDSGLDERYADMLRKTGIRVIIV